MSNATSDTKPVRGTSPASTPSRVSRKSQRSGRSTHVARQRAIGFPDNLLSQMVHEGLADHFSLELTGHGPAIWAVALAGDSLDAWVERARAVWLAPPSPDRNAWFFGTTPDIPRWAGYAIGFKLVGDYLAANPSRRASALLSEPATSFIP